MGQGSKQLVLFCECPFLFLGAQTKLVAEAVAAASNTY